MHPALSKPLMHSAASVSFSRRLLCTATESTIPRIVFTGGPCGGKSTAMSLVSKRLTMLGYDSYKVPEAATLMINGGVDWASISTEQQLLEAQKQLLCTQLRLEDSFAAVAGVMAKPAVVLCDRGVMDGKAYMSPALWDKLMAAAGTETAELRDSRYDAVVHLVSAAIGASEHYTTANNAARSEGIREAAVLDHKIRRVWLGAPNNIIVPNGPGGFEQKMQRSVDEICRVLGVPSPGRRRYFVLDADRQITLPETIEVVESLQEYTYIEDNIPGTHTRVQRRLNLTSGKLESETSDDLLALMSENHSRQSLKASFSMRQRQNEMTRQRGDKRIESFRHLGGREYETLRNLKLDSTESIKRWTRAFSWGDKVFEIDQVLAPESIKGLVKVSVECGEDLGELPLPIFLHGAKEVTSDEAYYSWAWAQKRT